MSSKGSERVIELLVDGLDDWVALHDVVWHGREQADDFGGDMEAAVRSVVREVIEDGLMYPGDLGDGRIDPWLGGADQLVDRVISECEALQWNPQGDGCWFANTPQGDRCARDYVARTTGGGADGGPQSHTTER